MKAKQLALVLVLLVALGGAALFLRNRNAASWSQAATTSNEKILDFPLNDVSQITIKGEGAELNLIKKEQWKVSERADYPADFEKVAGLLRKLWELRPAQDVKVGQSQLARLQLTDPGKDANSATLIELKAPGEKRLAGILLGKKHLRETNQAPGGGGFPSGRYVMRPDQSARVFLISETLDEVATKPESWLDHDFIKVEKLRSIGLVGATPGMNWKLARENETAAWKLLESKPGEEVDAAKASSLPSTLANLTFADVLDAKTPPAEIGLDKPAIATIETFDNFRYELRFGKLRETNYPISIAVTANLPKERAPAAEEKPEDKAKLDQQFQADAQRLAEKLTKEQKLQERPYLIAKATVDQLLKDRSDFIKKESSPSPAASPKHAAGKETQVASPSPSPSRTRPR